MKFFLN